MTAAANRFVGQPIELLVGDFVAKTIQMHDWRFFVNDKPLSTSMMAGNRSMLPALLWNAEKTHQMLVGSSLGVQFRSDGEASVGAQAVLGEMATRSRSQVMIFVFDSLISALELHPSLGQDVAASHAEVKDRIAQGRKVPPNGAGANVDHFVQAFFEDDARRLLPWTPDSQPKSPNLAWAHR